MHALGVSVLTGKKRPIPYHFVYTIDCLTESCDENIFPWTSVLQKKKTFGVTVFLGYTYINNPALDDYFF